MVTIKELSKLAKVSPTTISNVIHGRITEISPKTLKKVQQIISETGYTPNMAGKSLVCNKSQLIGVILNTEYREDGMILQDGYHGEIITAIEEKIREEGYYMLLYGSKNVQEALSVAKSWNIDGLIVLETKPQETEEFIKKYPAVVFIDGSSPKENIDLFHNVHSNDFDGGHQVAKYFLSKNFYKVAFVADEKELFGVDLERWRGLLSLYPNASYIDISVNSQKRKKEIRSLISNRSIVEFDALFFNSDILAIETIIELNSVGLRVPDDICIVGYDDSISSQFMNLTTIKQHTTEKGRRAVELLIAHINGKFNKIKEKALPVELIIRN
ncbi:MAG: LacI family DNA-binding transcriptional regulator [Lactococcus sp.]